MSEQPYYVSWEPGNEPARATAMTESTKALESSEERLFQLVERSKSSTRYANLTGGINVTDEFAQADRDYFRPGEARPTTYKEILQSANLSYRRCGLVRNVIDLMADFACRGIDIQHPSPRWQKWYSKEWAKSINMAERTERILNTLYRLATVPISRIQSAVPVGTRKVEIPTEYVILNPLAVEVVAGDLAPMLGKKHFRYAVRLPQNIIKKLDNPEKATEEEAKLMRMIPRELLGLYEPGSTLVPLKPNETVVLHYKRDDWQAYAEPMVHAIYDDLLMLRKLKLADLCALDAVMSHVRVWKMGSMEHRVVATNAGMNKFTSLMTNAPGNGGAIDIVWSDDLELIETKQDGVNFLGDEKYRPTLAAVHYGLGIPFLAGGSSGSGRGGFSADFFSLKILTERLQYGRNVVKAFWEAELAAMQKAIGHRHVAKPVFEMPSLTDEASLQKLWVELLDRGVLSEETVLELAEHDPDIEAVRLRRERSRREKGKLPAKLSPLIREAPEAPGKTSTKKGRQPGATDKQKRTRKFKVRTQVSAFVQENISPELHGCISIDRVIALLPKYPTEEEIAEAILQLSQES